MADITKLRLRIVDGVKKKRFLWISISSTILFDTVDGACVSKFGFFHIAAKQNGKKKEVKSQSSWTFSLHTF